MSRAHSWLSSEGMWAAARSPASIMFGPLVSAPQCEDLSSSPTETHGAHGHPGTSSLGAVPCEGGQTSSSWLSILAGAHVLIHQKKVKLLALNPPLRSTDSSLAALHTCLQECQFPG